MSQEQAAVAPGRWYPNNPPMLPGEDLDAYTNRLTGADGTDRQPYDHRRNRQCSIGWHGECSDPSGESCECPCHPELIFARENAATWNVTCPVGTLVTFGDRAPEEPDVVTTGEAWVEDGYAVVELDTFPRPVRLAWLEPVIR